MPTKLAIAMLLLCPALALAQTASSTLLSAAPNPTQSGQMTTLTATVITADYEAVKGSDGVVFYDGTTVLATQNAMVDGTAEVTVGPLSRGDHTLTAVYLGSAAYNILPSNSAPVTLSVVGAGAMTTTTLDVSPAASKVGERLTLTGRVTSPGGTPSGTIKFYDGDAVLNAQPAGSGTVSFATADLAEGEHRLSAVFTPGSAAF